MSDVTARYGAEDLNALTAAIFRAEGLPPADAMVVAESLVSANLRGVDTHGVARVPAYVERFRTRLFEPAPTIAVDVRISWAIAVVGGIFIVEVVDQSANEEVVE